jgi:hypothetical protein
MAPRVKGNRCNTNNSQNEDATQYEYLEFNQVRKNSLNLKEFKVIFYYFYLKELESVLEKFKSLKFGIKVQFQCWKRILQSFLVRRLKFFGKR